MLRKSYLLPRDIIFRCKLTQNSWNMQIIKGFFQKKTQFSCKINQMAKFSRLFVVDLTILVPQSHFPQLYLFYIENSWYKKYLHIGGSWRYFVSQLAYCVARFRTELGSFYNFSSQLFNNFKNLTLFPDNTLLSM